MLCRAAAAGPPQTVAQTRHVDVLEAGDALVDGECPVSGRQDPALRAAQVIARVAPVGERRRDVDELDVAKGLATIAEGRSGRAAGMEEGWVCWRADGRGELGLLRRPAAQP